MSIQTLWPNSDGAHTGWSIQGDVNPATYWNAIDNTGNMEDGWIRAGSGSSSVVCGLTSYTLSATQRCYGLRGVMRRLNRYTAQVGWEAAAGFSATDVMDTFSGGSGGLVTTTFPWRRYRLTQTQISNLNFKATATAGFAELYWCSTDLDIYTKPVCNSVSLPTGAQASRIVTTTWSPNYQGGGSYAPNPTVTTIKFFRDTSYEAGGFNPDTQPSDGPTFVVPDAISGTHSYTPPDSSNNYIGDGIWKAYVQVAQNHLIVVGGVNVFELYGSDWVAGPVFTITSPPQLPTNITPAANSTVNTDIPTLGATVNADPFQARSRVEWQLATDASFTSNVRSQAEGVADLRASGTTSEPLSTSNALYQGAGVPGTWFIRARQLDQFGTIGDWTAGHSFYVSHPPSATGLVPTGGIGVPMAVGGQADVTASWTFSDPSPLDSQTAFQVVVERVDDATTVVDSGKTISTGSTYDFVVENTDKDVLLRWKIRLWDRDDVVGSYSPYSLFVCKEVPIVEIEVPVENEVIENPTPLVTWVVDRSQSRYRVTFGYGPSATPSATPIYDTGWVTSGELFHQPTTPILETARDYWVEVQSQDAVGLAGSDRNYFYTSWIPPAIPTFSIDVSPYDLDGYVNISWTDAELDPEFYSYRLYRRPVGTTEWLMLVEYTDIAMTYEYHDWLAGSGVEYEYLLNQAAIRFGVVIEGQGTPQTATAISTHYWLIHPTDTAASLRLRHVTEDSFSEEYEQETFHVLERGRHVDVGDRLGYIGSLTAELRDDELGLTAREQRLAVEALRADRSELYLRNPFGDVFLVMTGDIQIDRLGGVGRREFSDLTLEYTEVAP